MSENNDEFFTSKHERLEKISQAADVFAWIILVVYVLLALMQLCEFFIKLGNQFSLGGYQEHLISILNLLKDPIGYFLQAVGYWLVLKGISLGLNMIIETDLNYREKSRGTNHE
jgi:hypothetical protein